MMEAIFIEFSFSGTLACQFLTQLGSDTDAEHFDGANKLPVRKRRCVHLKSEAGDAAQRLAVSNDLLDYFVGAADEQCSVWTALRIETAAGDGGPSALLPDVVEGAGVAGKEVISRLL